jgi:hypothetical protein
MFMTCSHVRGTKGLHVGGAGPSTDYRSSHLHSLALACYPMGCELYVPLNRDFGCSLTL